MFLNAVPLLCGDGMVAWDFEGKMFTGALRDDSRLLQFIGKEDRLGKEIYEGHIVRIRHPDDIGGDFADTLGEVYYWDDEACFYHGNQAGRPSKRFWKYCEIVGNIYENPELLKEGEDFEKD